MSTRFKTLGRQSHPFGRVELEMATKDGVLTIQAHRARDLFNGVVDPSLKFQLRVHLVPRAEPAVLVHTLFKPLRPPRDSPFKKSSKIHAGTCCPIFNEVFQWQLEKLHGHEIEFQVAVALVSSEPMSSSGSLCAGCFVLPLHQLASTQHAVRRWFWLLDPNVGLTTYEVVAFDVLEPPRGAKGEDDVQIGGRLATLANSKINGTYQWSQYTYCGRPVFYHSKEALALYWVAQKSAWVISDSAGSPAPFAFVVDDKPHPGDTTKVWHVFSKDVEYGPFQGSFRSTPGVFEVDRALKASRYGATLLEPALISRERVSSIPRPPVAVLTHGANAEARNEARARAMNQLADSHALATRLLQAMQAMRMAIQGDLGPLQTDSIFLNTNELCDAAANSLKILQDLVRREQGAKGTIGAALQRVSDLLSSPLQTFARGLHNALAAVKALREKGGPGARAVSAYEKKLNLDLAEALQSVGNQAKVYMTLIGGVLEATASTHSDYQALSKVHGSFAVIHREMDQAHARHGHTASRSPSELLESLFVSELPPPDDAPRASINTDGQDTLPRRTSNRPTPTGSAYSPAVMGLSRRMSLVPDAPLDEDELPVAENHTASAAAQPPTRNPATQRASALPVVTETADSPPPDSGKPTRTWLHGAISKVEADEALELRKIDGQFLLRQRSPDSEDIVMSLTFRGKPTHHLVMRDAGGRWLINRKQYGPPTDDLDNLLRLLAASQPPAGWPQRITDFVPNAEATREDVRRDSQFLGLA
ncbi:uncharacterized protein MONBRDRAFT_27106 [Monosiga brevicollis MX1]|uniref:SH2 domain-containing protein n=1 Tax=Monosiga brevicollis TaxID=81824 RepID=A9V4B4_MONBE|nr:uncharacterized protein MONBRDRAFT_27106 [Monosiga brevicollis MX1]EDQ87585.1 predicted protein [Monosiga brevicollis MX1]|eukprot:XP_001747505.1 hypothetical protein [Monosiga brevicollis MX1]